MPEMYGYRNRRHGFRRRGRRARRARLGPYRLTGVFRPEIKTSTTTSASSADSVASDDPFVVDMTGAINQGTLITQRVANVVNPKSIVMHMQFSSAAPCTVVLWVVQWYEDDSQHAFAVGEFLGSPDEITTHSAFALRQNFKVLKRITVDLVPPDTAIDATKYVDIFIKPSPLKKMYWSGATAATALNNHIFFAAISNIPVAAVEPTIDFSAKFYFTDQ